MKQGVVYATEADILNLDNLESLNAEMIKQNISRTDRFMALHRVAGEQLVILERNHADQNFRRLVDKIDAEE